MSLEDDIEFRFTVNDQGAVGWAHLEIDVGWQFSQGSTDSARGREECTSFLTGMLMAKIKEQTDE